MGYRKKGKKRANGDDATAEGAAAHKRGGGGKSARRDNNAPTHVGYDKASLTNAAYEEYYKPLVPEVHTRTTEYHPGLAILHMRV